MKLRSLSFVCILAAFLFLVCSTNLTTPKSTYTKEELQNLPAGELFQTFLDHGLQVDKELFDIYSEKQLTQMFKNDFDMLIDGHTRYNNFYHLSKDVKRVYHQMIK